MKNLQLLPLKLSIFSVNYSLGKEVLIPPHLPLVFVYTLIQAYCQAIQKLQLSPISPVGLGFPRARPGHKPALVSIFGSARSTCSISKYNPKRTVVARGCTSPSPEFLG